MSTYSAKFLTKARSHGWMAAIMDAVRFAARKCGFSRPPYDYVQRDAQKNLHAYLHARKEDIQQFIIVGAHLAHEVFEMLRTYPSARFTLFEPSPRYIGRLRGRFKAEPRVLIVNCAVTDSDGLVRFFETNLPGSGSILTVGDLASKSYGMEQREEYSVASCTLDSHLRKNAYPRIDCLWIDVQGAELAVLRGANTMLGVTYSVFIEVSAYTALYNDGATLVEISAVLESCGFRMVALGTDPLNGTGNALYVRPPTQATTRSSPRSRASSQ